MIKVVKIEVVFDCVILLLDNKAVHTILQQHVPVPKFLRVMNYYKERGYDYFDFTPIDALDFSHLEGVSASIYRGLQELIKNGSDFHAEKENLE